MLNNKGFTLIEVLVVVGISTLILATTYAALNISRRTWLTGDALLSINSEARQGLEKMLKELRLATSGTVDTEKKSIRFSIPIDADGDGFIDVLAGTSTIVYGADDHDDFDGDGVFWEAGWKIEYLVDPAEKQIIRRVLNAADVEVSKKVIVRNIKAAPPFTYFATIGAGGIEGTGTVNDKVRVGLTVEAKSVEGFTLNPPMRLRVKTQVNLRN